MKLTNREEEIMGFLWENGASFVKEIIASFEEPKPHYNTISTIVRNLEKKGLIDHEDFGSTFRYFAVVSREQFGTESLKSQVEKYFNNSYKQLVSNLVESHNLSADEINELLQLAKKEIK